jgi:hypothetical protein
MFAQNLKTVKQFPTGDDAGAGSVSPLEGVGLSGLEPLFDPFEVAQYLKLDVSTVRRLFLDRPDVVKIGRRSARAGRRSYVTLRIPLSAVRAFLLERSR